VKTIYHQIEIVDANCTGCYRCERACPTAAIHMEGPQQSALAIVNNDRCIACMRCIDACDDDAMLAVERDEPLEVGIDVEAVDDAAINELCRKAKLDPELLVCVCSGTQAKEVAAAIVLGSHTYEDVELVTGVQSGCLLYCSVPLRRLLTAYDGNPRSTSKLRRVPIDMALLDVPPEVDKLYPTFGLGVEQAIAVATLDELGG